MVDYSPNDYNSGVEYKSEGAKYSSKKEGCGAGCNPCIYCR